MKDTIEDRRKLFEKLYPLCIKWWNEKDERYDNDYWNERWVGFQSGIFTERQRMLAVLESEPVEPYANAVKTVLNREFSKTNVTSRQAENVAKAVLHAIKARLEGV